MIDFPASPTPGQRFTAAGATWIWDGAKWLPEGLSPTVAPGINENRIINGDMRIDQRNNGTGGTITNTYTCDRWFYGSSQASKAAWQRTGNGPVSLGFPYCLAFQSSSAYASISTDEFDFQQRLEADAISDFAWGTAGAQPVTLSFIAISSLSGAFSGSIRNFAGTRSYPFTYSLAANTWTKIVVTIPGDTAGTWVMTGNAAALLVTFDLGSGSTLRAPAGAWASGNYVGATGSVSIVATNGATFYVTGVKLEVGSVATPFNRQSLAKSMADCQRYYQVIGSLNPNAYGDAANRQLGTSFVMPTMRATPTVVANGSAYGNCSGASAGGATTNTFTTYVFATSIGFTYYTCNPTLSAEF